MQLEQRIILHMYQSLAMVLHKCKLYAMSAKNYFTHVSKFEQWFYKNVNYMQ